MWVAPHWSCQLGTRYPGGNLLGPRHPSLSCRRLPLASHVHCSSSSPAFKTRGPHWLISLSHQAAIQPLCSTFACFTKAQHLGLLTLQHALNLHITFLVFLHTDSNLSASPEEPAAGLLWALHPKKAGGPPPKAAGLDWCSWASLQLLPGDTGAPSLHSAQGRAVHVPALSKPKEAARSWLLLLPQCRHWSRPRWAVCCWAPQ